MATVANDGVIAKIETMRQAELADVSKLDREIEILARKQQAHRAAAVAFEVSIDEMRKGGNGAAPAAATNRAKPGEIEKAVLDEARVNHGPFGPLTVDRYVTLLAAAGFKPESIRATIRKMVKAGTLVEAGDKIGLAARDAGA